MAKIDIPGARRLTLLEMNNCHLGKGNTPLSKIARRALQKHASDVEQSSLSDCLKGNTQTTKK